jgi:hypothetical protein
MTYSPLSPSGQEGGKGLDRDLTQSNVLHIIA